MSLPTLFSLKDLLKKKYLFFVLGFAFTIVSVFFSLKLFPQDPGIVGVVFVSMMSLRILSKLFDKIPSYKSLLDYSFELYQVYLFLFFGVFVAFLVFSSVLPSVSSSNLFHNQLNLFGFEEFSNDLVEQNASLGGAISFSTHFLDIFSNNFVVLFFCFIVSFFFGSGALFIILWNASVWGIVLGHIFRSISLNNFLILLISILPHTILEVSAYILAAISGVVLSSIIGDDFSNKKDQFKFFMGLLFLSFFVLLFATLIESF